MDAMACPAAVRFKIQGQAYVIDPIALCAANMRKDMEFGIGATSSSVLSRRPRERPSGTRQPLNFILENNTFRKVLGPGSGAGAAW
ncbi:MAG: hypothetical protein JJ902_02655 [Roseibium sp.]|nr:hypothetical protein [Roseibium sp.]